MKKLYALIKDIGELKQVVSIGISGSVDPLPKPEEGDIDVFIYCSEVPDEETRRKILDLSAAEDVKTSFGNGPVWGVMDYCEIEQVETFLMYFRADDVLDDIREIKRGRFLWKTENGYFPVGRLAMFSGINILYDKNNFLHEIKESLKAYPEQLKQKMVKYHTDRMYDSEDFGRAVSRKDIFFYHYVLDNAVEHFLMALFALNETYFPGRKRTKQYIDSFPIKPENCITRLEYVIKNGAEPESIAASHKEFKELCKDLEDLTQDYMQ